MAAKKKATPLADGVPVFCSHTAIVNIENVVPNPRNPNQHPENQVALLSKIIAGQGWRNPIVISKRSGFVVKGHGRLCAAQALGVSEVPIDEQEYDSEAAEYADLIADNRIAELAEISAPELKDLLEEIDTGDLDMDLTGFDEKSLEELMSQFHVDDIAPPELPDGDKVPFRQVTFTLHDEQFEEVEAAISKAKEQGHGESAVNENSNGNALAWVCQVFNRDG